MKTFEIEIKEMVSKTIEIAANSLEEATLKARLLYDDDFTLNKKSVLIDEIIEYLIKDEAIHYEECDEADKPKDHIYLKLLELKGLNKKAND